MRLDASCGVGPRVSGFRRCGHGTRATGRGDSINVKLNPENKFLYKLFNLYNNENIIIKNLDENQLKIYSRRDLLSDAAVAVSEIYNEYITNHVNKQEVL